MPNSMTGFGQASFADEEMSADVIVRSINGKHLKTKIRLAIDMPVVEQRIASLVSDYMLRGTVDVSVRLDWAGISKTALNERMISGYANQLRKLGKKLGLSGEISIERIARLPGAMTAEGVASRAVDKAWRKLEPVVVEAVERACKLRASEGRALAAALRKSCSASTKLLKQIEALGPESVKEFRKRLTKRINGLLKDSGAELDPGFLAREVIVYG